MGWWYASAERRARERGNGDGFYSETAAVACLCRLMKAYWPNWPIQNCEDSETVLAAGRTRSANRPQRPAVFESDRPSGVGGWTS